MFPTAPGVHSATQDEPEGHGPCPVCGDKDCDNPRECARVSAEEALEAPEEER